jgi:hypothetical protein
MRDVDGVAETPESNVVLKQFGSSAIVLECRFYISDPTADKRWQAQTDVISTVADAFADAGIKIPFPQRELAGRPEAGGLELAAGSEVPATAVAGNKQSDGEETDGPRADGEAAGRGADGDEAAGESADGAQDDATDDSDTTDDPTAEPPTDGES